MSFEPNIRINITIQSTIPSRQQPTANHVSGRCSRPIRPDDGVAEDKRQEVGVGIGGPGWWIGLVEEPGWDPPNPVDGRNGRHNQKHGFRYDMNGTRPDGVGKRVLEVMRCGLCRLFGRERGDGSEGEGRAEQTRGERGLYSI